MEVASQLKPVADPFSQRAIIRAIQRAGARSLQQSCDPPLLFRVSTFAYCSLRIGSQTLT
jgi:hypothetical protein